MKGLGGGGSDSEAKARKDWPLWKGNIIQTMRHEKLFVKNKVGVGSERSWRWLPRKKDFNTPEEQLLTAPQRLSVMVLWDLCDAAYWPFQVKQWKLTDLFGQSLITH